MIHVDMWIDNVLYSYNLISVKRFIHCVVLGKVHMLILIRIFEASFYGAVVSFIGFKQLP